MCSYLVYVYLDRVVKTFEKHDREELLIEIARKFGKDDPPQFLYDITTKKPKRIDTSNTELEKGKQYRWELEDWNCKYLVQSALFCSKATYEPNPYMFLQAEIENHGVTKLLAAEVVFDEQSASLFLLGDNEHYYKGRTLVVAFRGTLNKTDIKTDFEIELKKDNSYFKEGKIHGGFLKRMQQIPIGDILILAKNCNVSRILTCGHSLGGAVSSLCHMRLHHALAEKTDKSGGPKYELINMTFGAPFFGNKEFREYAERNGFDQRMFHFASASDIVPIILSNGQLKSYLKGKPLGVLVKLVDYCIQIVSNVGFKNSEKIKHLNKLFSFLNENPETMHSDTNESSYVPIGDYLLIIERSKETVVERLQNRLTIVQTMLNNGFKTNEVELCDIRKHHSLDNYIHIVEKVIEQFRIIKRAKKTILVEKEHCKHFIGKHGISYNFEVSCSFTCAAECNEKEMLTKSSKPFVFCEACYFDPNTVEHCFHLQCSEKDGCTFIYIQAFKPIGAYDYFSMNVFSFFLNHSKIKEKTKLKEFISSKGLN